MGTPQTRCREIHHSERDWINDSRRLRAVKEDSEDSDIERRE